jgi:threonine aldolase
MAERWPKSVDPEAVRTNIVCADLERLPENIVGRLAQHDVLTGTIDPRTFRICTHKDVDDNAVNRVIDAFDAIAS